MKSIIIVFAVLAIIPVAVLGGMYIMGMQSWDQAVDTLIKAEAVILLFAVCSIGIGAIMGGKKADSD